jgi:hypothetical protein
MIISTMKSSIIFIFKLLKFSDYWVRSIFGEGPEVVGNTPFPRAGCTPNPRQAMTRSERQWRKSVTLLIAERDRNDDVMRGLEAEGDRLLTRAGLIHSPLWRGRGPDAVKAIEGSGSGRLDAYNTRDR